MDEHATALEVATAIRKKEVSPVEVLDECLARVDARNPALNAVIWRNDDEARAQARALADRIASGEEALAPFAGVPLPIKDLLPVAGQPLTLGSNGASAEPSTRSEIVADRLVDAGFVLTGRTNTPEFGAITITENLRYGVTRNPWDTGHTPGGSSGGAAAAVASGMFPIAQGGDGGGSIRIPSSCCGLVGLKPSRGRIPSTAPMWMGMATEGVLTRTVADTAAVLDLIGAPDPYAWSNAPVPDRPFVEEVGADPGRLRVALCTTSALGLPVAPEPVAAVERAGNLLESLGHHVTRLDADVLDPAAFLPFLNVVNAGLGESEGIDWSKVEPHNRNAYQAGRNVDSLTMVRSYSELARFARTVVARFDDEFDLVVTPTMAIEPPRAGILEAVLASAGPTDEIVAMAAFTCLYNMTGQPAISLPLHMAPSGLPVGVQVVAGPWHEAQLLRVAAQLESAEPWAGRFPPTP